MIALVAVERTRVCGERAGQQFARGGQRHVAVFVRRDFLQRAREPGNLHAAPGGAEHLREELFGFGPADLLGCVEQTETEREGQDEITTGAARAFPLAHGGVINVLVAIEKIPNVRQGRRPRCNELLQPINRLSF